jgi:sensor histidine kinase regulating citrate/malate metabolism
MGKGVEYQKISTEKFNAIEQVEKLLQAGGKIYFSSEENKGTTFTVQVPLTGMIKKIGSKALENPATTAATKV